MASRSRDYSSRGFSAIKDIVSAGVFPSGKVIIYTGILSICKDEDGLAAVLGHEIGHVMASHVAEDKSKLLFFLPALIPISPILILALLGFEMRILLYPYTYLLGCIKAASSRRRESEADYIGLVLMAKAGYDVSKAAKFLDKMDGYEKRMLSQKNAQGKPMYKQETSGFLASHPHTGSRAEKVREWLPEVIERTGRAPPLGPSSERGNKVDALDFE
ncbi:uncharacterized protein LY89DRAFT_732740 [Mollisia scopiformis]|uniref:Peptidase M48 domain-containing protein n=1 Tax=Mollisia scopiformis TaxID=149040 RepID=A0A194XD10_MOLSC|nr:uncharacterized protein LY89DRAFT_732740 [Mollisia scopiformis]KUJ18044.1 hypothetical protein LY89DRAFT_732740 [Mollisia scopiformis]